MLTDALIHLEVHISLCIYLLLASGNLYIRNCQDGWGTQKCMGHTNELVLIGKYFPAGTSFTSPIGNYYSQGLIHYLHFFSSSAIYYIRISMDITRNPITLPSSYYYYPFADKDM